MTEVKNSSKPKIGVLIERLNVGGVEKTAIQEVIALREMGVDAKLLTLTKKAVVEGAYSDLTKNIPIEHLDQRLPKPFRFSFKFPLFAFFSLFHLTYPIFLPFVIKNKEFDYIISHGSYTTFTAVTLRKFRNIPYSIYFWDPVFYIVNRVYGEKIPAIIRPILSAIAKSMDKFVVGSSDYIFVAGYTHNNYFVEDCGFKKQNIIVINPATSLGKPSNNKADHILMLTTWKAGKRPEYVFELVKEMPNLKIKMGGGWVDPNMKKEFIKERDKLGFKDNIELLGALNQKQLLKEYPVALAQLTTNLEKGFGMPVLEAAACGTVSIVPIGSGVCSVFEDGVDVFYTTERDTAQIVKALKKLTQNKQVAIDMGLKAYNRAKDGYTWEVHAKKVMSAVNKLL